MHNRTKKISRIVSILVLVIVTAWMIFPFFWAITTSIKTPYDVYQGKIILFLQYTPTLEHWKTEFQQKGPEIWKGLKNSLMVSGLSSILVLLMGTLAGYSLTRAHFNKPSNLDIYTWILSQRILVPVTIVIPFFLILKTIGLIDTIWGLALAYTTFNLPLAILIMKDFFQGIPIELEDSALVDGCSEWSAFLRISLPLIAPGLATAYILCFAFSWNEFLFALSLTYRHATTIPVIIMGAESTRGIEFWYISVRSLLSITPPVVLVMFVQRHIVRGLTMGAVKG